jgi:Ca2+/Na+ antiporter
MVMLASILMLMSAWTFGKKRIDRIEGGFFVACYIAYMIWLLN